MKASMYSLDINPYYTIIVKRIHVSSMESSENLVFENLAKPSLYSHTHKGEYYKK